MILQNVTQQAREQDRLPEEALVNYLLNYQELLFPDLVEKGLHIQQFEGGASNLTYQLSSGDVSLVLRRPPAGTKAKKAHDMSREYQLLKAVHPIYSYAPKAYLLCEDESVLGYPFFIMESKQGVGVGKELPVETSQEQNRTLCLNWIKQLTSLHKIDITTPELAQLGKPEGYVSRQLEGWTKRYKQARTPDVPDIDYVVEWLTDNLPQSSGFQSLIHNDYKFDNFLLNKDNPTEIVALLDWEMSTLGDPLMELGCSLAYWVEANDPVEMQMIRRMPTHLPGMFSRQQIFDRYCEEMGISQKSITPYYVFGLFRLAGIAQQIYYRFYHQQTDNPIFKNFGKLVAILLAAAIREIRKCDTQKNEVNKVTKLHAKDLFDLSGKVTLITGASRGIGESVAKLFVANGCKVIISSRNQEALDQLAEKIGGDNIIPLACHIGDADSMEKLLSKVKSQFGKIDILVNNAATNPFFGELLDTPDSAIEKTIDVNIKGYLRMSQMVGKMMRDSGGGVIINTASVNGVSPAPMQGIYSMTKATVMSMTAALAKETAKYNIRVNSVLPGLTDTKFASSLTKNKAMLNQILPLIPMGRMAQPDEIAPAFLFLASDAASYITGINLPVDGGLLA